MLKISYAGCLGVGLSLFSSRFGAVHFWNLRRSRKPGKNTLKPLISTV